MKSQDLISRIDQLSELARETLATTSGAHVDSGKFSELRAASLSFLESLFPADHAYVRAFKHDVNGHYPTDVKRGRAILLAVRKEIAGGWLMSLTGSISGEILGDFVGLAKKTLDENKDVSAVLVCAALEDALKRLANQHDLDVADKNMPQVINALKTTGILKGPQASIAKGYVELRKKAFHAQWDRIKEAEVGSAISFAEGFLLEHFG